MYSRRRRAAYMGMTSSVTQALSVSRAAYSNTACDLDCSLIPVPVQSCGRRGIMKWLYVQFHHLAGCYPCAMASLETGRVGVVESKGTQYGYLEGEHTRVTRVGRTVYLKPNNYIKTNHYINESRKYVGKHKLTRYLYFRYMEWVYLLIFIASIFTIFSAAYSGALRTGSTPKSSDLTTFSTRVFTAIDICIKLNLGSFWSSIKPQQAG